MPWIDAGVTEQNLISEKSLTMPAATGGPQVVPLQKAGIIRRLRFWQDLEVAQSAGTGAPSKSAWGPLGSSLKRIQIMAAGRKPFYQASGLMTQVYNEIINRDGSPLAPVAYDAASNVAAAKALMEYTAPGAGAQTYKVRYPFEIPFSIPLMTQRMMQSRSGPFAAMNLDEVGLWVVQERKTDLTIENEWYPGFSATASARAPYSGGTGVAAAYTVANSLMKVERDLYTVPQLDSDLPDMRWVHTAIEYSQAISGKKAEFDIPQTGALLRAICVVLDANDAFVEYDDCESIVWSYGTNDQPIARDGRWVTQEYLQDYFRYPPKGVLVLDFYKWGWGAARLARNTDVVANLMLKLQFTATTSGTVLILLESLLPNVVAQA